MLSEEEVLQERRRRTSSRRPKSTHRLGWKRGRWCGSRSSGGELGWMMVSWGCFALRGWVLDLQNSSAAATRVRKGSQRGPSRSPGDWNGRVRPGGTLLVHLGRKHGP
jgi:hypothetical protein